MDAHVDGHVRVVAAALARAAGFEAASAAALRALAGLFAARLRALARAAARSAAANARAQPTPLDVEAFAAADLAALRLERALETRSPAKRRALENQEEESLPLFRHREFCIEQQQQQQQQQLHLPPYPSVHTYKRGEISGQRETDTAKLREIKAMRALEVDANLRRLLLARESLFEKRNAETSSRDSFGNNGAGLDSSAASNSIGGGFVNYQVQRNSGNKRIRRT